MATRDIGDEEFATFHVGNVAGAGSNTHVGNMAGTGSNTHVGNVAGAAGDAHLREARVVRQRAEQAVPPAVRRAVLIRDDQRCVVPGCVHASFLDVHHMIPRWEGGGHDADHLVTVCPRASPDPA